MSGKYRAKIYIMRALQIKFCILIFSAVVSIQAQVKKGGVQTVSTRTIAVQTEPKATIRLDGVKFGVTDANGVLTIRTVAAGAHVLSVRADGFKEVSQNLPPTQKGVIKIVLTKTTDEAELAFQQAESSADKEKAADLYEKAVRFRPKYAEAYVGLARVLSAAGDTDGALKAIANARKIRPGYAEASAVEGRIHKDGDNDEKAIASFKRAIVEGKNFQPEAQIGLGLLYKERAEAFGTKGDFAQETAAYNEAAKYLQIGLKQLSGAPDAEVVYELLGLIYEKTKKFDRAIETYNEFLQIFPESSEADAVRSFIVQIKKQTSGQK